jgi:hypothetical protein
MTLPNLSLSLAGHDDAVSGALLGAITSAPLATGAVEIPAGAPWWAGYVATLLVALAPIALKYVMSRPQSAPAAPPTPTPPPCSPPALVVPAPAPSLAPVVDLDAVRKALADAARALPASPAPEVKP